METQNNHHIHCDQNPIERERREREREREPSLSINLKHQPNEKSFGEGIFMRKSAEREQYPKALEIERSKSDSET